VPLSRTCPWEYRCLVKGGRLGESTVYAIGPAAGQHPRQRLARHLLTNRPGYLLPFLAEAWLVDCEAAFHCGLPLGFTRLAANQDGVILDLLEYPFGLVPRRAGRCQETQVNPARLNRDAPPGLVCWSGYSLCSTFTHGATASEGAHRPRTVKPRRWARIT
jgi:hypothetical protein